MGKQRHETYFKNISLESKVGSEDEKKAPQAEKKLPRLFGDREVCRVLGIRRREIAKARTRQTRGKDWDAVQLHAGMTFEWCVAKANAVGKSAASLIMMQPIKNGDLVSSCKLIGGFPNCTKAAVQLVADPERRRIVTVKDTRMMVPGEIFDVDSEGRWTEDLNGGMKY